MAPGLLGCVEDHVVFNIWQRFPWRLCLPAVAASFHICERASPTFLLPLAGLRICTSALGPPLLTLCSMVWISMDSLSQKEKPSCCSQIPQSPVRAKLCCNGACLVTEAWERSTRDFQKSRAQAAHLGGGGIDGGGSIQGSCCLT